LDYKNASTGIDMDKVIIVIPAYNEENVIAKTLRSIKEQNKTFEIVVIDDGSADETAEIARREGAIVVSLINNLGYGAAVETGYKYAFYNGYDIVVQIDADGQHDPRYIAKLLAALEEQQCDVVIGSRFYKNVGQYKAPLARRIGMLLFQYLILIFTKKRITDPTSGFIALRRQVLEFFIKGNLYPNDYPDADVIILLNNAGFKINEIPVVMYENTTGKSMHSGWKPIYYVIKMFLSIFIVLFGKHRTFLRRVN
jgi:glycosyltransferase involved in cell wall biosynthesis